MTDSLLASQTISGVRTCVKGTVGYVLAIVFLIFCMPSCRSSRHTAKKVDRQEIIGSIHVSNPSKTQNKIIEEAYTWLGTPYKYAGEEKGTGTDCSGMVMKIYEEVEGLKIPRNSAMQAEYCEQMEAKDVDAGDLVFFATGNDPDRISHVGIVIDDESFIHASASKGVVVSYFSNDYYRRTFKMFGRVPKQ